MSLCEKAAHRIADVLLEAWNNRDLNQFSELLAEDVVLQNPLIVQMFGIDDGCLRGRERVVRYVQSMLSELPHTKIKLNTQYYGVRSFALIGQGIFEKATVIIIDLDEADRIRGITSYFDSLALP